MIADIFASFSIVSYLVFTLLIALVITITIVEDWLALVILFNLFSLLMAFAYLLLSAPDVALTEAAIGACLSSMFLLIVGKQLNIPLPTTNKLSVTIKLQKFLCLAACAILASYLIALVSYFPDTSQMLAPSYSDSYVHYIGKSGQEIGITEVVTSILASYRGYDTLAETSVIILSGYIVFFLLAETKINKLFSQSDSLLPVILKIIIPIGIIFLLYLQLNGESGPGGGFQAGAIAASLTIAYQLFSKKTLQIKDKYWLYCSALGLAIYQLTGWLCLHKEFLNYNALPLPEFLHAQKSGIFLVELGIGIAVFSVMVLIFQLLRARQHVDQS